MSLLAPTALIVLAGLYVVTGTLVEGGHRALGDAFGDLDFACLVLAFFFGPIWVTQAFPFRRPPTDDGPPRGGVVPLSRRTPGDAGTVGVVTDRSDRAA